MIECCEWQGHTGQRSLRPERLGDNTVRGKAEDGIQIKSDQTERLLNKPYVNEVTLTEQNTASQLNL